MAHAILHHTVEDYDKWRPLYDEDEARRTEAGIRTIDVYRDADNPNNIFMYWEVDDPSKLTEMLADPELKEKMKAAGVTSEPVMNILNSTSNN